MPVGDTNFSGSIPEIYDRYLVPLIFEPYAWDLAGRIAALAPGDMLELAAGTGVLTRALAALNLPRTRIVATDLNQAMLDRARTRQPGATIVWQQADAMALPFGDGSFDLVAAQFGAMFFPDKIAAYRETLRVLKPGGHYLFNVWDAIAANDFAATVSDALAPLFPSDTPLFMARIPHGYHDPNLIRRELLAAGFKEITVETVAAKSRAAAARDAAIAFCQGTPLRNEIENRGIPLAQATDAAEKELLRRFGNGPIEGRISALVVTARH